MERDCYVVEVFEVRGIETTIEFIRHDTLHHNIDTEGVEAFADELLQNS